MEEREHPLIPTLAHEAIQAQQKAGNTNPFSITFEAIESALIRFVTAYTRQPSIQELYLLRSAVRAEVEQLPESQALWKGERA